ncbi:hypothetical protein F5X97DRAFT_281822 [Nemania serpens]|nr:hypothetical protein F5X97DRAFT_281822 [Nemania serpens]
MVKNWREGPHGLAPFFLQGGNSISPLLLALWTVTLLSGIFHRFCHVVSYYYIAVLVVGWLKSRSILFF